MENKKIKIVYILGSTIMAGSTISFKIILNGVIELGNEAIIFVSNKNLDDDFVKYIKSKGCIVEKFDDESYIYPNYQLLGWENSFIKFPYRLLRKFLRIKKSNLQVLKLIKKYNPDIVHTNVGIFHQGVKACEKLGIPHLWHLREYQTKDFGWKIIPSKSSFKNLLRTTNVVTITNDILEYFDLKNTDNASAIWNGILPSESVFYEHKKKPYFLCANRISPEKRIEVVIEAFASVSEKLPNYRLMIVGISENKVYLNHLIELVSRLHLKNRIEFHDFRDDVINLMIDSTALVVASNFEGLGRMTVEATFMGCLVLGRNTGGTKEILNITGGGYLFDTTKELGQLMIKAAVISNTEDYKKIIHQSQRIVIDNFSNEQYCLKIIKLYQQIIKNQKKTQNNI